jgi:hypothetical protein
VAGTPRVDGASAASGPLTSRLAPTLCLDVSGASADPGTPTTVWTCHGGANQQFTLPAPGTTGEIRAYGTLCLDAFGGAGTTRTSSGSGRATAGPTSSGA